jgi:glycosyltransferase involved in cell wall biosynthesis
MIFEVLVAGAAICSLAPMALFIWNLTLYRAPRENCSDLDPVSVLIPARNEEVSIAAAVTSVLASKSIAFELVVLDDGSTDRTAEIVAKIAAQDKRVRVESAPPLPSGWNGKQHACFVLASLARYDQFCFLDADVRLAPDALARMAAFLRDSNSGLVSGFPHQETENFLEWLLLPLIHFVLLSYLPLAGMRWLPHMPGFAAGCGQFLLVRREAYVESGGHAAVRTTMHDGILLPRLLRSHGFRTDMADLTTLATCRMYRHSAEVWSGLAKNATEGMAAPSRIFVFSLLLVLGQIVPLVTLVVILFSAYRSDGRLWMWILAAVVGSFLPRFLAALRFRQPWKSAWIHPFGIAVLLVLQWYALLRKLAGRPAVWKQRAYTPG